MEGPQCYMIFLELEFGWQQTGTCIRYEDLSIHEEISLTEIVSLVIRNLGFLSRAEISQK